ncbi:MAG: NADH-quinone oxidoreductase subunit N [Alphaproteobacteria bacterium GM202ARS2]|nr:NADH-quinone oxidoreductase subunit N [Alphaproteobacteria bacterium GM202ARS2]
MMFQQADYIALLPEIIVASGALFLLLKGVFARTETPTSSHMHAVLALLGAQAALIFTWQDASVAPFQALFVNDSFAQVCRSLVLVGTAIILVLAHHPERRVKSYDMEFNVLMLLAALGMMIMVSAANFLVLYLGMELQALCLYVLVAIRRARLRCVEAGMKFFMLGGIASLLFLYGISVFYGLSGSLSYDVVAALTSDGGQHAGVALRVATLLVLSALAFKMTAAPFHVWAPDVYQGSSMRVLAFIATVSKVVGVIVFLRLLEIPLRSQLAHLETFLFALAALSMTVGSLAGLRQTDIKRLLAYSGISQMGFALIATVAWRGYGFEAVFVYMLIYFITMLGVFALLLSLARKQRQISLISDLAGLSTSHGGYALALAIFMFSLIGLPPFAGFFAKLYVFFAAIEQGHVLLVVWAALMTVVAAGYYLRIIKVMYMDTPQEGALDGRIHIDNRLIVFLTALFTVLFVLAPRRFWDVVLSLWPSALN